MKSNTILALAAAATAAHAEPASSVSSTSVTSEIKDGQGTVTITIEKDGKKETRTLKIDPNTPFHQLTDQIVKQLGETGVADPASVSAKKVTYLGVMLSEPGGGFGADAFGGLAGGLGGGNGGQPPPPGPSAPGLPPGTGLTVTGVTPDSPAAKAGLQAGDVLAKLNDQILVNSSQFTTLVRNMKEGDVIKLAFVRNGEAKDIEATLASRAEDLSLQALGWAGALNRDLNIGRVLTIDPQGNVIEATPGSLVPPPPPQPPGAPALPPVPPAPPATDHPEGKPLAQDLRPAWEKALREAASAKDKAASQWQEQLSKWRAEWTDNQKRATDEYRKAMEKMGEELAKAREAAEKAREEARRAVEEVMRKIEEDKAKSAPQPEPTPEPTEPAPLKNA